MNASEVQDLLFLGKHGPVRGANNFQRLHAIGYARRTKKSGKWEWELTAAGLHEYLHAKHRYECKACEGTGTIRDEQCKSCRGLGTVVR